MDYDRLALFLAGYTTGGFRRSLHAAPQATLTKCGFNPAEAAQLAASMARHGHGKDKYELTKIQFTFSKISNPNNNPGTSMTDNWAATC